MFWCFVYVCFQVLVTKIWYLAIQATLLQCSGVIILVLVCVAYIVRQPLASGLAQLALQEMQEIQDP